MIRRWLLAYFQYYLINILSLLNHDFLESYTGRSWHETCRYQINITSTRADSNKIDTKRLVYLNKVIKNLHITLAMLLLLVQAHACSCLIALYGMHANRDQLYTCTSHEKYDHRGKVANVILS